MSQTQFDDSITLVIEDRKIQCSKELLMLKSDYFRVMFSHNYRECNEKIITLEGVDGKAMEDLLQVLLNMTHYRNISDICKVILLSDMFLFDDLKEKLIQETTKSLSLKNCLQIWLKLELMPTIPLVWKAKSCVLNYKDISILELKEIKRNSEVMKYPDLMEILDCIIELKVEKNVERDNKYFEIALSWLNSRGRFLPNYFCLLSHEQKLFCHGHSRNDYLTKIITLESNQLHDLVGFEVQVYKKKIYIFGGEFSIGKGIWNDRFWHCNIERKKLNTKCGTPIKRRHFKSCVAGGFLYIIGGTGKYRIRKNDMLHFNFKSEKWGTDVVQLPCCPTSLKYCAFNEKLFILDCHSKLGYFYVNDKNNWLSVNIAHTVNLDDVSSLSIFSYRGHLFMKGKKLVELEYINDTLQPIKVHDIPNYTDGVLIETLNSYNRVYSTYADPITGIVSLEYLNLDDLTSVFFNSVGLLDPNQPSETTQLLKYNPNLEIKMFMCHHDILAFHEDILVDD
ncbi:kelch-like protein 25 isoform X3 [Harmonia axyridis]|uniref:kelch-like protein 25 isoform X3 n=1 Tax=Harmonia axyridis TaxID=115357 RepID=UPI001E276F7D|nr:kelch-like protein 25 isoform X3 [Harmonia axyridis]